jgi:hypothetical protein
MAWAGTLAGRRAHALFVNEPPNRPREAQQTRRDVSFEEVRVARDEMFEAIAEAFRRRRRPLDVDPLTGKEVEPVVDLDDFEGDTLVVPAPLDA